MQRPVNDAIWPEITETFRRAFRSSFHFSVATVDASGQPHVSPVGSVLLGVTGRGIYFDVFATGLRQRLTEDSRVCVSAVDSGITLWARAMLSGTFSKPVGVRLYGKVVGAPRKPTEAEVERWRRRVRALRHTRGYQTAWGHLETVRDFQFESYQWVTLGKLTASRR